MGKTEALEENKKKARKSLVNESMCAWVWVSAPLAGTNPPPEAKQGSMALQGLGDQPVPAGWCASASRVTGLRG